MPARAIPYLKVLLHLGGLLPFLLLLQGARSGSLSQQADPVNYITHFTGNWALWILLADLAITPVRRLHPSLSFFVRFRRMVGLYAFFYATLHLLTYVLLFSGYDVPAAFAGLQAGHLAEPWLQIKEVWPTILGDLKKRTYIQVGLFAWVALLLLAITSPQRILRAMGGKNWGRLHKLIYAAGVAALIHYWWLVKAGVRTPWKVTTALGLLLLARVGYTMSKRWSRRPRGTAIARA